MSDTLKEYVVTLQRFEDLDNFYNDMETPGGDLYIPNRSVDVQQRRNVSRNTHYMLNDAEAETFGFTAPQFSKKRTTIISNVNL